MAAPWGARRRGARLDPPALDAVRRPAASAGVAGVVNVPRAATRRRPAPAAGALGLCEAHAAEQKRRRAEAEAKQGPARSARDLAAAFDALADVVAARDLAAAFDALADVVAARDAPWRAAAACRGQVDVMLPASTPAAARPTTGRRSPCAPGARSSSPAAPPASSSQPGSGVASLPVPAASPVAGGVPRSRPSPSVLAPAGSVWLAGCVSGPAPVPARCRLGRSGPDFRWPRWASRPRPVR